MNPFYSNYIIYYHVTFVRILKKNYYFGIKKCRKKFSYTHKLISLWTGSVKKNKKKTGFQINISQDSFYLLFFPTPKKISYAGYEYNKKLTKKTMYSP